MGPRSGEHDGEGARRGTLVYGHESVSPPNDPKAEGIRLEREHRSCKVLYPSGRGSAPVGKGDETGRMSGLLMAVLDRYSSPAGES